MGLAGSHRTEIRLEDEDISFASALPTTMRLARRHRKSVLDKVRHTDSKWPFEDRVLVWLDSFWAADVAAFHVGNAQSMAERFDDYQLSRIDKHYSEQLRAIGLSARSR
jgi:hypothetical protein